MALPDRTIAAFLLLLAGCTSLQVEFLQLNLEEGRYAQREGLEVRHLAQDSVGVPLVEAWSYNAGAAFGVGPPLVVGERVLVGTRKGEVHAIDLESGKRLGMRSFGAVVEGASRLYAQSLVVPVASGRKSLFAYDLVRSQVVWSLHGTPIEAGLLRLGETVVAVDTDAVIRRVNAEDGMVLWERTLARNHAIHAAPVAVRGHIVVADDQGVITALDPTTGAVRWEQELASPVYANLSADDSQLYVSTTRGRLYALAALDGGIRWQAAVQDTSVRLSSPAVEGDLLIVGATDGRLRAFSASRGDSYWTLHCAEALVAVPLMTPNAVFVGSMGGMLYAVDRHGGKILWQHKLRGRVKSALAAGDGYVVVLSEPRHVTLFKTAGEENDTES